MKRNLRVAGTTTRFKVCGIQWPVEKILVQRANKGKQSSFLLSVCKHTAEQASEANQAGSNKLLSRKEACIVRYLLAKSPMFVAMT